MSQLTLRYHCLSLRGYYLVCAIQRAMSGLYVRLFSFDTETQLDWRASYFVVFVSQFYRIIGTIILGSLSLFMSALSYMPKKCRIHPSTYTASPPQASLVSGLFIIVFQNYRSGCSSQVFTKLAKITLICSIQVFRTPSQSYCCNLSSFSCMRVQSALYPAIQTLLIPHIQNLLLYWKNFCIEFIIMVVDITLQVLVVVEKSHQKFYTTPSTVYYRIFVRMQSKKLSHYFYCSLLSCSGWSCCFTVRVFLPLCLTSRCRSFQARQSMQQDTNFMMVSQISSGTSRTSPCWLQACRKDKTNALDGQRSYPPSSIL